MVLLSAEAACLVGRCRLSKRGIAKNFPEARRGEAWMFNIGALGRGAGQPSLEASEEAASLPASSVPSVFSVFSVVFTS